ncbi:hypothetical protein BDQ17DRAFT_1441472 [Cyathus striatus]|nr:hypothetical protein BDQ17DRAFT_1441472 [Cyathus striatus]
MPPKALRSATATAAAPALPPGPGTVTPASLIQASAPQDSFNFLSIKWDDLFNDDESHQYFHMQGSLSKFKKKWTLKIRMLLKPLP